MLPAHAAPLGKPKWLAIGALVVLLGLVLRAAWVTEDAYITLRTVDNWVNGFGLRWNTDERVQGYTHPLWMMLLSAAYYVTREAFGTTIFVAMATTLAALLMLVRNARTAMHGAAAVTLLIFSTAFVQFSTSGLENPLTHLLLALFIAQYAVRQKDDLLPLSLTAALIALNRTDALLAVLPALLHVVVLAHGERGAKQVLRDLLIGFSPLLAWEAFSLFYYGFPVPNTAYAKLNTGLPRNESLRQGLTYLLNAVAWDTPLLMITALGVCSAFMNKRPRLQLLALGAVLYLIYVVWIGGDFMQGRFLTLPLFMAVSLIALSELPLEDPSRAAVVLLPFFFVFWQSTATEKYPVGDFMHSGVADERNYYREAQLMMFTRLRNLPSHQWVQEGKALKAKNMQGTIRENVGYAGFFAGPAIHIIDELALVDALLARLPAMHDAAWRVGHYRRKIPDGYVQTVLAQKCVMEDKNLCQYYDKLREITAGELWSWSRFKTILAFNLGSYEYLLDRERYRFPNLTRVKLYKLQAPVKEKEWWNGPGTLTFPNDGLSVDLGYLSHAGSLSAYFDGNDEYTFEFRHGNKLLATVETPAFAGGLMQLRTVKVPEAARREGFDTLMVVPGEGDGMYSIGQLRLAK